VGCDASAWNLVYDLLEDRAYALDLALLLGGHCVAVPVSDFPLAVFTAVDLRGPQDVGAWFTVNRDGGVFKASRVSHVAQYVAGQELKAVGRAIGELLCDTDEQLLSVTRDGHHRNCRPPARDSEEEQADHGVSTPWREHSAVHPSGVTWTFMRRRQAAQYRGGSIARRSRQRW
jgi:hypothetical protein